MKEGGGGESEKKRERESAWRGKKGGEREGRTVVVKVRLKRKEKRIEK